MRMQVSKQARIRFLSMFAMFILVAATIYVSAASRQGTQQDVRATDVKEPSQVREALLFDPFEPEQPIETTLKTDKVDSHLEAVPQESAQVVAEKKVDLAPNADVQLAAADLPEEEVAAPMSPGVLPEKNMLEFSGRLPESSPLVNKANGTGGNGDKKGILSSKLFWVCAAGAGIATAIALPIALSGGGGGHHGAVQSPSQP